MTVDLTTIMVMVTWNLMTIIKISYDYILCNYFSLIVVDMTEPRNTILAPTTLANPVQKTRQRMQFL